MTTCEPALATAVISACVAAMPEENALAAPALELAERLLERAARRVGRARVVVVADELARRGLHVGRGLVDGRDDAAVGRVGLEARVHDAGGEAALAHARPATRAGRRG